MNVISSSKRRVIPPIGLAESGCDVTHSNVRGSTSAIFFAYSTEESTEGNRVIQTNGAGSEVANGANSPTLLYQSSQVLISLTHYSFLTCLVVRSFVAVRIVGEYIDGGDDTELVTAARSVGGGIDGGDDTQRVTYVRIAGEGIDGDYDIQHVTT